MILSLGGLLVMTLSLHNAQAEEGNIPAPIFIHSRSTQTQEFMNIERIAGCYGNLDEARSNIRAPKRILKEPIFQSHKYAKGVLDVSNPSCILDDKPQGVQPFSMRTIDFEEYLFMEFNCGCVQCYIDEETYFERDEVLDYATDEHKKNYAQYKAKRDQNIAKAKIVYEEYKKEYAKWSKTREETLKNEAVRVIITPDQDIPEGSLTVYHYRWHALSWCGDVESVSRTEMQSKDFQHPAIKQGEQLTIWFDNVNTAISWGVVLHDTATTSKEIIEYIQDDYEHRSRDGRPPEGIPEKLKGRMIETEPGRDADIIDQCCEC